jgi:hypothetical protein
MSQVFAGRLLSSLDFSLHCGLRGVEIAKLFSATPPGGSVEHMQTPAGFVISLA